MKEQIPLIYAEWDEQAGVPSDPMAKVVVSQGILFIRKLVNATILQNRIWEHTSHESEGPVSLIYVKPFDSLQTEMGKEMERTAFLQHDVAEQYEAEYWEWADGSCRFIQKQSFLDTWDAAQILLDHYTHINGTHYEFLFALLDPARKKILLYVGRTPY